MGYNVSIEESTFQIPVENLDAAYKAMCELNYTVPNSQKRGGSHSGKDKAPEYGPHKCCWFSWMDWNYDEKCKNAEEVLHEVGFYSYISENGNLHIDGYDSKTGQEDLFLKAISTLSKGYIIWKGEEGEVWGETYGGEKVIVKSQGSPDYSHLVTV
jgi:hypothetical protein